MVHAASRCVLGGGFQIGRRSRTVELGRPASWPTPAVAGVQPASEVQGGPPARAPGRCTSCHHLWTRGARQLGTTRASGGSQSRRDGPASAAVAPAPSRRPGGAMQARGGATEARRRSPPPPGSGSCTTREGVCAPGLGSGRIRAGARAGCSVGGASRPRAAGSGRAGCRIRVACSSDRGLRRARHPGPAAMPTGPWPAPGASSPRCSGPAGRTARWRPRGRAGPGVPRPPP